MAHNQYYVDAIKGTGLLPVHTLNHEGRAFSSPFLAELVTFFDDWFGGVLFPFTLAAPPLIGARFVHAKSAALGGQRLHLLRMG